MALRLIEIRLPGERTAEVTEALDDLPFLEQWSIQPANGRQIWHILAFAEQVEAIVSWGARWRWPSRCSSG